MFSLRNNTGISSVRFIGPCIMHNAVIPLHHGGRGLISFGSEFEKFYACLGLRLDLPRKIAAPWKLALKLASSVLYLFPGGVSLSLIIIIFTEKFHFGIILLKGLGTKSNT